MGNWKLEVFRMALYVSFPVGMFVLFNSPFFYEDAILEARRKMNQFIDHEGAEELRQLIEQRKQEQLTRQIEDLKKRKPT